MGSEAVEVFGVLRNVMSFCFAIEKTKERISKSEIYCTVDPSIILSPRTILVNASSFKDFVKMSANCSVV